MSGALDVPRMDEVAKRLPAPAYGGFRGDPMAHITPASGLSSRWCNWHTG